MTTTHQMEALHESGSIMLLARGSDLRTCQLLSDCGYTHVRLPTWDWESIATRIDSLTPRAASRNLAHFAQ